MIELTDQNVLKYLTERGWLSGADNAKAELLAWGVSNMVFRITPKSGPAFVVKQSRKQLRTKAVWFSQLERIHTEMDLMKRLSPQLPSGCIPQVLFEDRHNFVFGMEAVPADHRVWKADLLAGAVNDSIGIQAGALLAGIHRETLNQRDLQARFSDRTVFDELRIDPFYRYVIRQHPTIGPALQRVIHEALTLSICIVHADFSPKNLLLWQNHLTLVDFETGHFGDPAFDLGFFLSHLLLKTIKHINTKALFLNLIQTFWNAYIESLGDVSSVMDQEDFERRIVGNLGGCLLARVDGKSPIDYFDQPWQIAATRALAFDYLMQPVTKVAQSFEEFEQILNPHLGSS